jgi:hypothetical protein
LADQLMPVALNRHFSWGPKAWEDGGESVAATILDAEAQIADGRATLIENFDEHVSPPKGQSDA